MKRKSGTWTDLSGKIHEARITLAGRKKVREATEVDLLTAVQDASVLQVVLDRIITDDDFVLTALAAIEGVRVEDLESVADATVFSEASTALVEAIVDFFPDSSPVKKALKLAVQNGEILRESQAAIIEATLLQAITMG